MRVWKATVVLGFLVALWLYLNAGFGVPSPVSGLDAAPPGITTLTTTRYSLGLGLGLGDRSGLAAQMTAWRRTDEGFALRHLSALPDESTRGYVIIEDRAGAVPVGEQFIKIQTAPYPIQLAGKNQLTVKGVDQKGSVYLSYDGKEFALAPGERRLLWGTTEGRPHFLWIQHHGSLALSAFVPWETQDDQAD